MVAAIPVPPEEWRTQLRTSFHFVPQTIGFLFLEELVDEREECRLIPAWCADLIQSRCVADWKEMNLTITL